MSEGGRLMANEAIRLAWPDEWQRLQGEIDRLRAELAAAEDFKARCECAELACANSILHDQLAAKDKELAELREELLK